MRHSSFPAILKGIAVHEVKWTVDAVQQLAEIYSGLKQHPAIGQEQILDKLFVRELNAISEAADKIDELLTRKPLGVGEMVGERSRTRGRSPDYRLRILSMGIISCCYLVDVPGQRVWVIEVRYRATRN
jgi:hypothetical protein